MPIVSVIIPFYEGVDWLKEAIDSVLLQSFNNYEIIVVNDGSKENMQEFLKQYSSVIKYCYKENGGPSTARNKGIELATGKYIAFLDSDDKWMPQKLMIQVYEMEKTDVVWSYCGYQTFGTGKEVVYKMTNNITPTIQRYNIPYIATPCVMIRRDFLESSPDCRFNPALRYGQDSYLWLMINADNPILALPDILVEVRLRGANASKRARVQLQARSNVWQFRKKDKAQLIEKFELSFLYRFASELCVLGNKLVVEIEKFIENKKVIEIVSKVVFVLPWILFKVDRSWRRNV